MKNRITPHCKGCIVDIQGVRYRADFWMLSRTYEFIALDWEKHPTMHEQKRTEQEVSDAIKSGKIKIVKTLA